MRLRQNKYVNTWIFSGLINAKIKNNIDFIAISTLMFQHPKEDYLYYWVWFEYILESHASETINQIYSELKDKESIYSIKRFREQFVTGKIYFI